MKKIPYHFTVLILTLTFHLPGVASAANPAADFLVETGEHALAKGDAQTAIHEFSKALMLEPDHARAKMYLEKFDLQEGLYTATQTRESQMTSLASNNAKYKDRMDVMQAERSRLQQRIMMLEDTIERKGDHKLLKDIEDYYRHSAFYEVDKTLPKDEQLLALNNKHKDFLEYAFDKDRVQEKYLDVMEELLDYREFHLEDARDEAVNYRIALADNRRELLFRMEQLKALSQQFDSFRQKGGYYDKKEIEYLQDDLAEAKYQVNMLLDNRQTLIIRLNDHVSRMKEAL